MAFFPVKGFLSTGATFEADLNLLVQVVMGFKDWKRWMGAELTLWSIVVLTGVGTSYAWYMAPFR